MFKTGCDIEDISRFKDKTFEKNERFLKRIYTQKELGYCFKDKNYASHLAVRFCAKEAVYKALSGFYDKTISYSDIEILNDEKGAPYVNILIDELKKYNFSLSLSHEKEKALAFVIVF